jgi:hypothetical protein
MRSIWLLAVVVVAGCFTPTPEDGKQQCSSDVNRPCPSGYRCIDGTCWKGDHMPPNTAARPHRANANVAGATTAGSEHYQVVMSTGGAPAQGSSTYQRHGGVAGATQ